MTTEVTSRRERSTIYIVAGAVFAALVLVALFAFRAAESTQQAQAKANQLIAAFGPARVHALRPAARSCECSGTTAAHCVKTQATRCTSRFCSASS